MWVAIAAYLAGKTSALVARWVIHINMIGHD